VTCESLPLAVANLDSWLETMRSPSGYGGPISHWWESNFLYTAPLYDWRYEGIIDGYRELYLRTGQEVHLGRALQAADDLLPHLLHDGRFRNSSFQFGPVRGGTPHEAAIDAALLKLVRTLRDHKLGTHKLGTGEKYLELAHNNLESYWFGTLWNGQGFHDQPYNTALVANKHGTLLEALLDYEILTGVDCSLYIQACVEVVSSAQVKEGAQKGGTVHRGIGPSKLAIPIYTARAMNGLLSYYLVKGDERVRETIELAVPFMERLLTDKGIAWGIYASGQVCLNPQMIAGAGDVLRFFYRLHEHGLVDTSESMKRLTHLLLAQQQPGGGLPTAWGFSHKGLGGEATGLELRDVLPVVGWVDKTFRAFCLLLPETTLPPAQIASYERAVSWSGKRYTFTETASSITLTDERGKTRYAWHKGARSPDVYDIH
jgi:hypothetical protein